MTAPSADDLLAVPLLASLPAATLQELARLFTVRSYPKNAIIASEGDRLDRFNIILSGKIQWFWRDEAGHQLALGVEGSGGHFAVATLSGGAILMSVMAVQDLRVASIPIAELNRLLLTHPTLAVGLLTDVVARLRRLLDATRMLTMDDVYGRVVKLLLRRAVEIDGKLVTKPLTHVEIGNRVGATREMVGRIMRELARGGYIKADRGRVTILRKPPRRW